MELQLILIFGLSQKTWFHIVVLIFQNPKLFENIADIPNEILIPAQLFGLYSECNQPRIGSYWCKECNFNKFQQNFGNYNSGK
ncbi:uncharacterized protein OCT59_027561 [Rhizophagus irregularis]|uniref:uncharacterized protein n=1 Tax=Rhizophagus irregularis TaxID=588596 RepID=UPI00331C62FA|nr:hypothetical protein OCT59_027561 [Rhizophagus irregularis]